MTEAENQTLQMLKQIDQKLDRLLNNLSDARGRGAPEEGKHSLLARAKAIAALTPRGIKQTNSVELLREDRWR
jgi:hypothetical protein